MDLPPAISLAFGDAGLALVEQLKRAIHGIADLAPGRGRDAVARFKCVVDGGFEG